MHAPRSRGQHGHCPRFAAELVVHCDGKIGACCWDFNLDIAGSLGDINRTSVIDVWRGPGRAQVDRAMRSQNLADKPAKCHECVFLYNAGNVPMSDAAINDFQRIEANPYALIYHFPRSNTV